MKPIAALIAALLLGSCQSLPGRSLDQPAATPENLEGLLHQYSEQTGHNLTYNTETRAILANLTIQEVGPQDTRVLLIRPASARTEEVTFEVVALRYASAPELAGVLSRLVLQVGEKASEQVKILSDNRTNSLLVSGNKSQLAQLKPIIDRLDAEVTAGG